MRPKDVGQRGADQEDQQHLDQPGERGRILERMRRVGVEEAAAVGASSLIASCEATGPRAQKSAARLRASWPCA
jgi:hypothetical protein